MLSREEKITAEAARVRAECERLCVHAIVGPATAYFETVPNEAGETLRFVYSTQCGDYLKCEGDPICTGVIANQPSDTDIYEAAAEFLRGFAEIAKSRKANEGLVWRKLPMFCVGDDKKAYFRARYVFVPPCEIVFPAYADQGPPTTLQFAGGYELFKSEKLVRGIENEAFNDSEFTPTVKTLGLPAETHRNVFLDPPPKRIDKIARF